MFSICLGLLFCLGCASGDEGKFPVPTLGIVSGVVTLDEKPLANARVEFFPSDARSSTGVTDSTGSYQLTYDATHKGAGVGESLVRISTRLKPSEEPVDKVPAKYNDETELKAKVQDGENFFDFKLSSM